MTMRAMIQRVIFPRGGIVWGATTSQPTTTPATFEAREHFERAYLKQQLELCGGKVGQLAQRVGMERTHLYRKLRSLGIDSRRSVDQG